MQAKAIVPLIDLVFLTLGSILGIMSQMERVTALPVDVVRVGQGAAVVKQGRFAVVCVTGDGITLDGKVVTVDDIAGRAGTKEVVLRVEQSIPTGRTQQILAGLFKAGLKVSLEVRDQVSSPDYTKER